MPKKLRAGFPTYWTTFGQGPRAALMIHCTLGHSGAWGGMARKLSGALSMTAFDFPGHGRSGAWRDEYGDIQDVSARIAAELLDGPADIIGHSFGGTIALRLAVERPDLVRSLTLIEPIFLAVLEADNPDMARDHEALMEPMTTALAARDYETAAREFIEVWGTGRAWADLSEEQRGYMVERMYVVAAEEPSVHRDNGGMLAQGVLARIKVPVLLIEGSASPEVIGTINQGLARRMPQAERAVIAGAGHMVPITHADQVATEVLRLLARIA